MTQQRLISPDFLANRYLDLIKRALKQVDEKYYSFPTTYKPGLTRERVFCYEFYHQMRLNMPDRDLLTLHGEIDKRGHVDFVKEDRRNPDFIFHQPGTHNDNRVVMEVKGIIGGRYRRGVRKDFETLLTFMGKYRYQIGVFVLFGHSFAELMADMGSSLKALQTNPYAQNLYILCIKNPYSVCEQHRLSEV